MPASAASDAHDPSRRAAQLRVAAERRGPRQPIDQIAGRRASVTLTRSLRTSPPASRHRHLLHGFEDIHPPASSSSFVASRYFSIGNRISSTADADATVADHLVNRQRRLGLLDVPSACPRGGMLRREQGAAILIRDVRDRLGCRWLALPCDLVLVHARPADSGFPGWSLRRSRSCSPASATRPDRPLRPSPAPAPVGMVRCFPVCRKSFTGRRDRWVTVRSVRP